MSCWLLPSIQLSCRSLLPIGYAADHLSCWLVVLLVISANQSLCQGICVASQPCYWLLMLIIVLISLLLTVSASWLCCQSELVVLVPISCVADSSLLAASYWCRLVMLPIIIAYPSCCQLCHKSYCQLCRLVMLPIMACTRQSCCHLLLLFTYCYSWLYKRSCRP